MLKRLINRKAQANIGEYALLFFLIMAFMFGISVYFKRGVQARIRDASHYAVNLVHNRAANSYNGVLWLEYEPYYVETRSKTAYAGNETSRILEAQGTSGIFKKQIDNNTQMESTSIVAPPKDAD